MNTERNLAIKADRANGMTYRAIGLKHGLSTERIRQILTKLARWERDQATYVADSFELAKAQLSPRAKYALEWCGLPDLNRETIREQGPMWWMRVPNCGKKTVQELEQLVGGWPDGLTSAEYRERDKQRRIEAARQQKHDWDEWKRETRRLVAEREARERAENEHETTAQSLACLIEVLEDMRPYDDIGPKAGSR